MGVDLNRNYPFMFGIDNYGSGGAEDPCRLDYRGPSPFSEPETANIRDFVQKWPNIKVAINIHAYGNMLIHPFNFDTLGNKLL
jgi:carboxypeptidase T